MINDKPIRIRNRDKALETLIAIACITGNNTQFGYPRPNVFCIWHHGTEVALFVGTPDQDNVYAGEYRFGHFRDSPTWLYENGRHQLEILTLRQWRTRWIAGSVGSRGFGRDATFTIGPVPAPVATRRKHKWPDPNLPL